MRLRMPREVFRRLHRIRSASLRAKYNNYSTFHGAASQQSPAGIPPKLIRPARSALAQYHRRYPIRYASIAAPTSFGDSDCLCADSSNTMAAAPRYPVASKPPPSPPDNLRHKAVSRLPSSSLSSISPLRRPQKAQHLQVSGYRFARVTTSRAFGPEGHCVEHFFWTTLNSPGLELAPTERRAQVGSLSVLL